MVDEIRMDRTQYDLFLRPLHWPAGEPVDDPSRVRGLNFQTDGSQWGFSFWSREGYVSDVRYLLVQKYDYPVLVFAFEEL